MCVVGGVCLLLFGELRLPVARAHLALVQRLASISLDDFRERDDGTLEVLREGGVGLTGKSTKFDEVRGEDAEVTEELLAVICDE